MASLRTLSMLLSKHYGKQTILLMDEYDVPQDKAFQYGYYDEMLQLIRSLLGNVLKTNEYLKFAVLTGCLHISKESIFMGLNNFNVMSVTDRYFEPVFGFRDEDVKELIAYYGLEFAYETEESKREFLPWDAPGTFAV
ncbi:MAG: AAA family ATPase [Fusicatenibacter sp.]